MHIHILGICGTFMGSLAILAKELGHQVSGSDANVYPPMSTQLEAAGISLMQGYDPAHLKPAPDLVIVGNAMSRGNAAVEYVLNEGMRYTSGPQWLADEVLHGKWVLAVSGTHGKTTTSSMLAWILDYANMAPGFLIGGVPQNFDVSARLGGTPFFVVEADEYDSAFFDKRSKFVHYRPRTAILNNLEFDHADIFENLEAIQKQFHHFVRTVPGSGLIVMPDDSDTLDAVISKGCWTPQKTFSLTARQGDWSAELQAADGSHFTVWMFDDGDYKNVATVQWSLTGNHSVSNALAAMAAARHVGVTPEIAAQALAQFAGVKRRMEVVGTRGGITVFDDFAHHPTAIETTLQGLRNKVGGARIVAIIEPRSNTMRLGSHKPLLAPSTACANEVIWYQPAGLNWSLDDVIAAAPNRAQVLDSTQKIIDSVVEHARGGDQVVIMSNGGFEGIHHRLLAALEQKYGK